jgi:hypothetical protein
MATPPATRAIARSSVADGSWRSTAMPTTVAVAGRSETNSAYVERAMRASASWSQTYGITDELMATPRPAPSATGSASAEAALQPPIGVTTTAATSIALASPSMPPACSRRATRWARTM